LDGFHPTGTLGVFGATAACARLLRLGEMQTLWSLGIAGTLASGLRANRGTFAKALNAGHAAQSGVLAAALAQTGFTASENIFDDPMGFFAAAAKNKFEKRLLRFGKPLFFETPGLAIKLYPCPGTLHPTLDVLLDLVKRHNLHPDQVRKIRIAMAPEATLPLVYDHPKDGLQGKFSLPFIVAIAVAERMVGLRQFSDKRVADPRIKQLMQRVELIRRTPKGSHRRSASVELVLRDGQMLCGHTTIARGHPKLPASRDDIENKFRQCARGTLSAQATGRFLENFWSIEQAASMANWLGPLRARRR
jgi:2-methylcitrate dehydratase PrpD